MRVPYNHVLVRFDRDNDEILMSNGEKLKLVTAWEPYMHSVTSGVVEAVCEKLLYDPKNPSSALYKVPIEVKVGDRIIFDYKAEDTLRKDFAPINGCYPLRYDSIYVAIRGQEVIPVNGIVIVEADDATVDEQVQAVLKAGLETTLDIKSMKSKQYGTIRYIGSPVEQYAQAFDQDFYEPDADLKVGDRIHFDSRYAIELQYPLHQILDKGRTLYRLRRKNINYVIV
jgi:co-chaperonin GroES (HSP10)